MRENFPPNLGNSVNSRAPTEPEKRQMLDRIMEKIENIELEIHYLVFDLEATRRERDEFEERLRKYKEGGCDGVCNGCNGCNEEKFDQ